MAMTRPQRTTNRFRLRAIPSAFGYASAAQESMKETSQLASRQRSWLLWAILLGAVFLSAVALINWISMDSYTRVISKAEAAARMGDWSTAQRYWRVVNSTSAAKVASHLGEARACLALGQAAQAEVSLRRAISADPSEAQSSQLLLQILQVEDRMLDAQDLGWQIYDNVQPDARRELLQQLTLTLLGDLLPDEKIRTTLQRWVEADINDVDAQVALCQRIMTQPRAVDPDRASLLIKLEELVAKYPNHTGAREALATSLADAGNLDRGRVILDAWPEAAHDARYWRLLGRWDLEYEHQPEQAVNALRTALKELPQDWRTWYRLSRALRILDRHDQSRQAAEMVRRIREVMDPLVLGPRLHAAFEHLNEPNALTDLAVLCNQAGLTRLSRAWLTEAQSAPKTAVYPHL
jgi:tetratricopeptide (TPR) repeat protein